MIHHRIKNQNNKFLIDENIRKEIIDMLNNNLEHCYFEKQKIKLISDITYVNERDTIVKC